MIKGLLDFSGKVVLITGAATGIGRAVAVGFASRGAKVAIGDINEQRRHHARAPFVVDGGHMIRGLVPVGNGVDAGPA